MKSRLHFPTAAEMTAQQKEVHDEVLRTRGNTHGPFLAWLLNPQLAQPAQQLGAFCRYHTSLSLQESEMLILLVAAHHACAGEQQIHEPIALREGLAADVVAAIRECRAPAPRRRGLRLLAQLAQELLETKRLSDPLYATAVHELGEKALVEVVAVVGYYALVAYTLNAFEMKLE